VKVEVLRLSRDGPDALVRGIAKVRLREHCFWQQHSKWGVGKGNA
jgi:hypothetical protein